MSREGVTRRRRGYNGLSALLAVPLVVAGFTAALEYGRYADRTLEVAEVARAAAREGATRPQAWSPGPLDLAVVVVNSRFAASGQMGSATARLVGPAPDQRLEVVAEVPYEPLLGIGPTPPTARAVAAFRMHDQPNP